MRPEELRYFSPITYAMERLFFVLQYLSPANVLFRSRVYSQKQFVDADAKRRETIRRSRLIEAYVTTWFLVEIVSVLSMPYAACWMQTILVTLVAFRVFDIFQAAMNLNIFDRLRIGDRTHYVASLARTALFAVWNFFELWVCFGVMYTSDFAHLSRADPGDGYYFSVVTQLTIGYGDVYPLGATRALAMCQALLGFVLGVFAISRIIAFLPRTEPVIHDD